MKALADKLPKPASCKVLSGPVARGRGRGLWRPWPWPVAVARGLGAWPWSLAVACGRVLWTRDKLDGPVAVDRSVGDTRIA